MAITVKEASAVLRATVRENMRKRALLYLIQGGVLVAAGLVAVVFPAIFGAGVLVLIGWLLVLSGVVQGLGLIGAGEVPYYWLQLVSVVLGIVVGWLMISRPEAGLLAVALLMVVFFMVEGMARIAFALMIKPLSDWGWVLTSGLVGILMAFVLAMNLPEVGHWLLGLLLGVQLIAVGGAQAWMAWRLRKAARSRPL